MIDPDVAVTFLDFVEARHEAWQSRQVGLPQPWTEDPIVNTRKFTNVFRVLDHGSQFLVRELLEPDLTPVDALMRCFLYRHTNLPAAWEAFRAVEGYPLLEDLELLREFWHAYKAEGGQVFSGAYMIYPQSSVPGTDKVDSIIDLTKRLFLKETLVADFLTAKTQQERFAALRRHKGVADFMSMQILTDWGYSPQCGEDREDEFVVGGPGAVKGARAIDPRAKTSETIAWAVQAIRNSPNVPQLELPGQRVRVPSYMDAQNCLCEFSKYVRYQQRPTPAKPYTPAHPGPQTLVLPEHW